MRLVRRQMPLPWALAALIGVGVLMLSSAFAAGSKAPAAKAPAKAQVARTLCARVPVAKTDPGEAQPPRMVIPPGGRCEALFDSSGNIRLLLRYPNQRLWAEVFWGSPVTTRKAPTNGVRYFLQDGTTLRVIV